MLRFEAEIVGLLSQGAGLQWSLSEIWKSETELSTAASSLTTRREALRFPSLTERFRSRSLQPSEMPGLEVSEG